MMQVPVYQGYGGHLNYQGQFEHQDQFVNAQSDHEE